MRQGDLLKSQTSLAHCISRDLKMFKGLAKSINDEFPDQINQLRRMRLRVGQVGAIRVKGRFIYHLVFKERCTDQPRYDNLRQTLFELKMHMLDNNVNKISLPKIGSGMNRLSWPDVEMMIEDVFHDTNIKITIFESDRGDAKRGAPRRHPRKPEARGLVADIIAGLMDDVGASLPDTENEWLQAEADYENGLIERKESDKIELYMKKGNLLEAKTSLAHCVSKDLKMFKGLARSFSDEWPGQIEELKKMNLDVGQLGAIKVDERFIYHLIIKEKYNDQPKYYPLKDALVKLKEHMIENEITEISLPKIGTGKNQLSWPAVKMMIEEVFEDNPDLKITIFEMDIKDVKSYEYENRKPVSRFAGNDTNMEDEDGEEKKDSEKVSKMIFEYCFPNLNNLTQLQN